MNIEEQYKQFEEDVNKNKEEISETLACLSKEEKVKYLAKQNANAILLTKKLKKSKGGY